MTKSYDIGTETEKLLTQLQPMFGVQDNSAVLAKAIALAKVVSQHYDRNTGFIEIAGKNIMLCT